MSKSRAEGDPEACNISHYSFPFLFIVCQEFGSTATLSECFFSPDSIILYHLYFRFFFRSITLRFWVEDQGVVMRFGFGAGIHSLRSSWGEGWLDRWAVGSVGGKILYHGVLSMSFSRALSFDDLYCVYCFLTCSVLSRFCRSFRFGCTQVRKRTFKNQERKNSRDFQEVRCMEQAG
jgi:hypothetical protein